MARIFLCFVVLTIAIFAGIGVARAQQNPGEVLNQIPTEFKDKVDEKHLRDLTNKSAEIFEDKCKKNGGPEAYTRVKNATEELGVCIQSQINITILMEEIQNYKPTGKIDELFKKYCGRSSQVKGCTSKFIETAKQCFPTNEQTNLDISNNVTQQLIDFACKKDGDQIALFVAEGGIECYQEKQEEMQECVTKILHNQTDGIDIDKMNPENMPHISFDENQCSQISDLMKCIVGVLEKCANPTTGNIVDSLYRHLKKSTPCKNYTIPDDKPDSASGLTVTSLTVFMALVTAVLI